MKYLVLFLLMVYFDSNSIFSQNKSEIVKLEFQLLDPAYGTFQYRNEKITDNMCRYLCVNEDTAVINSFSRNIHLLKPISTKSMKRIASEERIKKTKTPIYSIFYNVSIHTRDGKVSYLIITNGNYIKYHNRFYLFNQQVFDICMQQLPHDLCIYLLQFYPRREYYPPLNKRTIRRYKLSDN